jgi:hypothetical protein
MSNISPVRTVITFLAYNQTLNAASFTHETIDPLPMVQFDKTMNNIVPRYLVSSF